MGTCNIEDQRATEKTCSELKEKVEYDLFKKGLYKKSSDENLSDVNLTITYFRNLSAFNRGMWGIMAGKEGLNVKVDVIDKQTGNVIGQTTVSSYNVSGANSTDKSMINGVSREIVNFLSGVESKK